MIARLRARPGLLASLIAGLAATGAQGCGNVTVATPDAADTDGGDTDVATDASDTGGNAACPIAACVAALRDLQAGCPTTGVACTTTRQEDQLSACFDNGVQADVDYRTDQTIIAGVVLRADGRVCYRVGVAQQVIGLLLTVTSAQGQPVIVEYRRAGLDSTFTCPDGTSLVDGPARVCGAIGIVPDTRNCTDGLCVRP